MYAGKIIASAVAIALLAAGCGSSDDSAGGSKSDGLGTLKVVLGTQYDIAQPGLDAGLEWKVWDNAGLKVEEITTDQGTQALATGDADIVVGAPNRVIGAIKTGLPAKMIGLVQSQWPQSMIVGTSSDAKSLEDLKGSKFGITSFGSAGEYSVKALADTLGWSASDYKLVTMGSLPSLVAGLKSGTIDAFPWSVLPALTAQKEGYGRIVGDLTEDIIDTPGSVLIASQKLLDERPEAVKAFCEGYYKAQTRFVEDPAASEKLVVGKWGGDATVTKEALAKTLPLVAKAPDFSEATIAGLTDTARLTTPNAADVTPKEVKGMTVNCMDLVK